MTPETEFGQVIEALERLMKPHLPKNPYSGTHVLPTAAWQKGTFPDWEIVMGFLMKHRPAPKAIDVEALVFEIHEELNRKGLNLGRYIKAGDISEVIHALNSRCLFGQVDQAAVDGLPDALPVDVKVGVATFCKGTPTRFVINKIKRFAEYETTPPTGENR